MRRPIRLALIEHVDDVETALRRYETVMFPRSTDAAAVRGGTDRRSRSSGPMSPGRSPGQRSRRCVVTGAPAVAVSYRMLGPVAMVIAARGA